MNLLSYYLKLPSTSIFSGEIGLFGGWEKCLQTASEIMLIFVSSQWASKGLFPGVWSAYTPHKSSLGVWATWGMIHIVLRVLCWKQLQSAYVIWCKSVSVSYLDFARRLCIDLCGCEMLLSLGCIFKLLHHVFLFVVSICSNILIVIKYNLSYSKIKRDLFISCWVWYISWVCCISNSQFDEG